MNEYGIRNCYFDYSQAQGFTRVFTYMSLLLALWLLYKVVRVDNLYWSYELGTHNFIPLANIITSDDNTESDSLTLFHPLGFELTASLWLVLSNHMHSASISSCRMC